MVRGFLIPLLAAGLLLGAAGLAAARPLTARGPDISVPTASSDPTTAKEAMADYQRAIRELERAKAEARGEAPKGARGSRVLRAQGGAGTSGGSSLLDRLNTPLGIAAIFGLFGLIVAAVVAHYRAH